MKRNKIFHNAMIAMATLSTVAVATACSDWDDHYTDNVTGGASASLWENIQANGNLSEFASLLKKGGYDELLNGSQTYTVWAPLDGTYNYDSLASISVSALQNEFLANHVAQFNFSASGAIDDDVTMLNSKVMKFTGNGSYSIDGVSVSTANLPGNNGTLYTINGKMPFLPNIFESLNSDYYPLDSISNFYNSYTTSTLDEDRSVIGPIVNGEQTYLDSVMTSYNLLRVLYQQRIQVEDSSYTMILPTNKAWNSAVATLKDLYVYPSQLTYVTDPNDASTNQQLTINNTYLQDSLVKRSILVDLAYNNNMYDNGKLLSLQTGGTLAVDSLVSTTGSVVYTEDANDLFVGATRVDKSNGAVWITDSLRMRPWTSWSPVIKVECEYGSRLSYSRNAVTSVVSTTTKNANVEGTVSGSGYLEVTPTRTNVYPEVGFAIPNVRSTTYKVYVVVAPANYVSSTVALADPIQMRTRFLYNDANGRDRNTSNYNARENDVAKVDTVELEDVTFPVAYAGTDATPLLRIQSRARDYNAKIMRLDCIILVPKTLDDYLKLHPEYKYKLYD